MLQVSEGILEKGQAAKIMISDLRRLSKNNPEINGY